MRLRGFGNFESLQCITIASADQEVNTRSPFLSMKSGIEGFAHLHFIQPYLRKADEHRANVQRRPECLHQKPSVCKRLWLTNLYLSDPSRSWVELGVADVWGEMGM